MNVTSHVQGDVFVLAIEGKILGGPDTAPFLQLLQTAIDNNLKKVIVDLHAVPWMTSSGLGMLIGARARLRSAGGELRLARPDETVCAMLVLNNLELIFGIHPTVEEAVSSFR
jgi:anti-sigma B factor antagonist